MKYLILFLLINTVTTTLLAQRAQFRGENRDGIYHETGLLKSWPEGGPVCVLTVEGIGTGHSSAVVDGNTIFITGMKNRTDLLSAIGFDGIIKWQVPFGDSWTKSFPDTRSTPTIDGDRIYVVSGTGKLSCINTVEGRIIWSRDVDKEFECEWHKWGVSESPLIWENLVVSTPAGKKTTVVAFDKMTGKNIWQTPPVGGIRTYASPVLSDINGQTLILAVTTEFIAAIIPSTGEVAWSYKHWQPDRDPNDDGGHIFPNSPLALENEIFLTRGYNYPAMMLAVASDNKSASEKWINNIFDNHHHGVVLLDGFLYGSNWLSNGKGKWVCLEWESGEVRWEHDWFNKGPIIFSDSMLYIMEEKTGNIGLLRPDTGRFDLVSSFKLDKGTGPYWAHPSIYDGKLYLRHGDVLMVYDIKTGS